MGYSQVKTDNKYLDCFIEAGVKSYFGLSLASEQTEVLKTMLTHDYVLFRHCRGAGATFLLALLSIILRKVNPVIDIVVASNTVRQAQFVNSELNQVLKRHNLGPLNVVSIEEALSGNHAVLLLDEITNLPNKHIESLIKHIEDETISKIISTCSGYRVYYPIAKLERALYSGSSNPNNNKAVIFKRLEDMPSGFLDLSNIEEIKKTFDYPEEFNMEYNGYML